MSLHKFLANGESVLTLAQLRSENERLTRQRDALLREVRRLRVMHVEAEDDAATIDAHAATH